jgi:hypothetical protein
VGDVVSDDLMHIRSPGLGEVSNRFADDCFGTFDDVYG